MAFRAQSGPNAGTVEVTGRIVRDRLRAVMLDGDGRREWLPKSKIRIEEGRGGEVVVVMSRWLARRKGYVS